MQNLRVLITTILFVLLLAVLAACIVETRPDRSMLIYVPPPVAQSSGNPDLTIQHGTIPGTIPQPMAPILMEEAQRSLATSTAISGTSPLTDTAPLTATLTPTTTPPVTATVTTTATQTVAPTGSATQSTLTPAPSGTATATLIPTRSGTRIVTPLPTNQATATPGATATATASRTATATATRQPTATTTRLPTTTPATPVATATPIPRTVFVGRNQGFVTDSTYVVVGEVLNGDSYPVFNVKVIGSFYDSNNNLVAAEESLTVFHQIEPELSSPFKIQVTNNGGNIDHYELTLTWDDVSIIDYEELTIERAEADEDAGKIVGELRNEGSVSVQDIAVVVTLYDGENNVVNVLSGTVDKAVLGTNEVASYEISLPPDVEFTRFEVQAQGALKLF